jgi:nicotinamide-nucleotide amidase
VQIELFFENGNLFLYRDTLYLVTDNGLEKLIDNYDYSGTEGKACWGNGHTMMMKRFYDALGGADEWYCDIEDAVPVLEMIDKIYETPVGEFVYGIDVGSTENALIKALSERGLTVSTAESCTGGLIAKKLTDVSGASAVFMGSCVTYANEAKIKLVGVSEDTLKAHGAVSEQTAIEMARGVREALGTDIGISTTGIAGPGGGSAEKPVGTIYVGISSKLGEHAVNLRLSPMRSRDYLRTCTASRALSMALEEILKL